MQASAGHIISLSKSSVQHYPAVKICSALAPSPKLWCYTLVNEKVLLHSLGRTA